jgi:hypothetical protein
LTPPLSITRDNKPIPIKVQDGIAATNFLLEFLRNQEVAIGLEMNATRVLSAGADAHRYRRISLQS